MKLIRPLEVSIHKAKLRFRKKKLKFLKFSVYVFVGEHFVMVDFVRCLQNRDLLKTGNYMVISVDDEIYDASKRTNMMERGKHSCLLNKIFNYFCF
jgi:hypothetical protein